MAGEINAICFLEEKSFIFQMLFHGDFQVYKTENQLIIAHIFSNKLPKKKYFYHFIYLKIFFFLLKIFF